MATNSYICTQLARRATGIILNHVQRRHMPVNVPPTATGKRRFRLEVETDPHKLVNYCCGLNYHVDEPPVKLRPDNEYPDWLWSLRLTAVPNSWDMEPGTKEYYLRVREEEKQQNYMIRIKAEREKKTVGKVLLAREEYKRRLRFAALAHLEDDVGLAEDSLPTDWYPSLQPRIRKRDFYLPVNENNVVYMDKIKGNTHLKNYHIDLENSFNKKTFGDRVEKWPSNRLVPFQDSKQRHRYSCM